MCNDNGTLAVPFYINLLIQHGLLLAQAEYSFKSKLEIHVSRRQNYCT